MVETDFHIKVMFIPIIVSIYNIYSFQNSTHSLSSVEQKMRCLPESFHTLEVNEDWGSNKASYN